MEIQKLLGMTPEQQKQILDFLGDLEVKITVRELLALNNTIAALPPVVEEEK
jgi:hypothetical protein